jgi:hypothetical protein
MSSASYSAGRSSSEKPILGRPDRRLVHADRHDVELTTTGGDVLRHTLAQDVFLERHPLDGMTGLLGEVVGETLHADHVTVVHGRDGDGVGLRLDGGDQRNRGCGIE